MARLAPDDLAIVWFEEGDGVALMSGEDILCIIPGWANTTCSGFSKECMKESPFAWPLLPAENVLLPRVTKAREFWTQWGGDSWGVFQNTRVSILEECFNKHVKYYAIDGGQWPPKALIRFEREDTTFIISIGVSLTPQPTVEIYSESPESKRRIEIALSIKTEALNKNEQNILNYMSAQTNLPWDNITWLGHGHTVPCEDVFAASTPYVICANAAESTMLPQTPFPSFREDPINVLWLVPFTAEERDYSEINGSEKLFHDLTKDRADFWIFKG